jgi:hypothetical protein
MLKVLDFGEPLFAVERNVPMPRRGLAGRPSLYPFADMRVGDSFFISTPKRRKQVASAAANFARERGWKFSVLTMPDKTYRCWRIK